MNKLVERLKEIKAELEQRDKNRLWEYHLPNNPATDDKIQQIMHDFKVELPTELIEFWKICNGWKCFYQMVDLLGTENYYTPQKSYAEEVLNTQTSHIKMCLCTLKIQ